MIFRLRRSRHLLIKTLISLMFVTFLFSCQHESDQAKVFSNSSFQLWNIKPKDPSKAPNYYYIFFSNGKCKYYNLAQDYRFREYPMEDDVYSNTWSLHGDTVYVLGNEFNYTIKNKDTILLSFKGKIYYSLIRSGLKFE